MQGEMEEEKLEQQRKLEEKQHELDLKQSINQSIYFGDFRLRHVIITSCLLCAPAGEERRRENFSTNVFGRKGTAARNNKKLSINQSTLEISDCVMS